MSLPTWVRQAWQDTRNPGPQGERGKLIARACCSWQEELAAAEAEWVTQEDNKELRKSRMLPSNSENSLRDVALHTWNIKVPSVRENGDPQHALRMLLFSIEVSQVVKQVLTFHSGACVSGGPQLLTGPLQTGPLRRRLCCPHVSQGAAGCQLHAHDLHFSTRVLQMATACRVSTARAGIRLARDGVDSCFLKCSGTLRGGSSDALCLSDVRRMSASQHSIMLPTVLWHEAVRLFTAA